MRVLGVHQHRSAAGQGEEVAGHHPVPQAQQPVHPGRRGVGHPVVVAQQAGGGTAVQAQALPGVPRVRREEPGRLLVEQRHQVVGEQAQLAGLGRAAGGPGRVRHRRGVRPPVVGAEEPVEVVGGAGEEVRVAPGGEGPVEGGEGLPGARGVGDLQRAVEAREAHLLAGGPALVVGAHPAYEGAVGRRGAEPVTEAALHDLVEGARPSGDVVVDDQSGQAVALQRDRPVALPLDQSPEQFVAHLEQGVLAVGRLAQCEHPGAGRQQLHEGGRPDGTGGVLDVDRHAFNAIVELSV